VIALKLTAWLVFAIGPPILFVLILPFWVGWSLWRGLMLRSRVPAEVQVANGVVVVSTGRRRRWALLDNVGRARLAINGNWTDSTLVEDALTLFDTKGRTLAKIPMSAWRLDELLRALRDRQIKIERVEVSAPAFLD